MKKQSLTKISIFVAIIMFLTIVTIGQAEANVIAEYRDRGQEVSTIQQALVDAGYNPGPVNGFFAHRTRSEVMRFQRDHGLRATGVVDQITWNLLTKQQAPPEPEPEPEPEPDEPDSDGNDELLLQYRDNGREVRQLQNNLNSLGYNPGPINGYYAHRTRTAVNQFQQDNGLRATGDVDRTTWNLIEQQLGQGTPKPEPQPEPEPEPEPQPSGLTADERQMLDLVNRERTNRGLAPLEADMRLVELARKKSQDMITHNYFSHSSPTYGSFLNMLRNADIRYRRAGENLAGNTSASRAHTALMNSSGHRDNILKVDYEKIGIGIVNGGPYGKMFTQIFLTEF